MTIAAIFSTGQPRIGNINFDATLEESTELQTDTTEFPIESGAIGSDHAVNRPLRITMRVGITDNASRASRAAPITTEEAPGAVSAVPSAVAIAAGLGGSVVNAAYLSGQAKTRSQSALDAIRDLQRTKTLIDVMTLKKTYSQCLITNTRQETEKENENALELVVELTQLITVPLGGGAQEQPAYGDTAESQGQKTTDLGVL